MHLQFKNIIVIKEKSFDIVKGTSISMHLQLKIIIVIK